MDKKIPFNKPFICGNELEYITQAVSSGHLSGDGIYSKKCSEFLEDILQVPKVLLTTSCTHALEMAAILLDICPEDEVIVPSFTFVSTINAFVLRGAKPVFIDIRADTLNMDENILEKLITRKTKAIIPVHYAGVGCEMDSIKDIADEFGIAIVEDNAHGIFAKYNNKYLSTFGTFGTVSFHETKNFICGEGGALIINDKKYIERAEIIREKGTDRAKFFRGEIDKYTWRDIGSSYLPSEILAAFLYAQFEKRDEIVRKSWKIYQKYFSAFELLESSGKIRLPSVADNCKPTYPFFHILLNDEATRNELIKYLNENGIHSVFHYLPLHLSPFCNKYEYEPDDLQVTELVSKTILRLPFFYELDEESQDFIIGKIFDFFNC